MARLILQFYWYFFSLLPKSY